MQNAKDTFYDMLRGRLAARSPDRTVVMRGVTRPAVLVAENELASTQVAMDCFVLRWTKLACDSNAALPTTAMTCEITYATAGTAANGGMDRGRVLAELDAQLLACLHAEPQYAALMRFDTGMPAACGSNLWWSDPAFSEVKEAGDRLQRVATVTVLCLAKAGAA